MYELVGQCPIYLFHCALQRIQTSNTTHRSIFQQDKYVNTQAHLVSKLNLQPFFQIYSEIYLGPEKTAESLVNSVGKRANSRLTI